MAAILGLNSQHADVAGIVCDAMADGEVSSGAELSSV
jgi:hypothetical protein